MKNLFTYIINLFSQKYLIWGIDWCTKKDFDDYCITLWDLNRENFVERMTYQQFYQVQWILAHEAPCYFSLLIKAHLNKKEE